MTYIHVSRRQFLQATGAGAVGLGASLVGIQPAIAGGVTFELWKYPCKFGWITEDDGWADHTFLKGGGKNFNCMGWHHSDKPMKKVRSVHGNNYAWSSGYRYDRRDQKITDTAGLGELNPDRNWSIYAHNGVCHTAANLFLVPSGVTITLLDGVAGYWYSSATYGTYGKWHDQDGRSKKGDFHEEWLKRVYKPAKPKSLGAEAREPESHGSRLFAKHQALIKEVSGKNVPNNELIHMQAALLMRHELPNLNTDSFKPLHLDYLRQIDRLAATGLRGKDRGRKMNDLCAQLQKSLWTLMGPEVYAKATGEKAGRPVPIVDLDWVL